jgi:hypothetical protein
MGITSPAGPLKLTVPRAPVCHLGQLLSWLERRRFIAELELQGELAAPV